MSTIKIVNNTEKAIAISINSDLSFLTVNEIFNQTEQYFKHKKTVKIDLKKIKYANSAAIALILEWRRISNKHKGELLLENIPVEIKNVASLSELETLLFS